MKSEGQGPIRSIGSGRKFERQVSLTGSCTQWFNALNDWREKYLFAINALAPAYFFIFVLGRVYLETAVFAPTPFFSYYTACHHMLWFAGTFLSIVLVIHFVLKIPIKDLVILCYGVTLTGLPLVYALVTGLELRLTYLRGGFWEIFTHALTFVWTYEADRALTGELILIFLGITCLGYLVTKSLGRAILAGVCSYAVLMLWAVHWVGKTPHKYAVFSISTWMVSNCLIAIVLLFAFTILMAVAIWRAGLLSRARSAWIKALAAGVTAWAAFSWLMWRTQWFVLPFDIAVSGLPVFTDVVILTALLKGRKCGVSVLALGIITGLFFIQVAVMGPVLVRAEEGLITHGELQNKAKRLEAIFPEPQTPGLWDK
ncbi:MAG: hypothetical protein JEZ02_12370 [Desulfatibacillum sp.]|nr:hypothetical protein [Desulfatibacillum sp.]